MKTTLLTSRTSATYFRNLLAAATAAFVLAVAPVAHAVDLTWNGSADTNWGTGANWGGTAPVGGEGLIFSGNTNTSTFNNLAADLTFTSISFTNDGTADKTSGFTLAGSRIILGGNIDTMNPSTATTISDIIDLDLILNGDRTFNIRQFITANIHKLTINGNISETGGAQLLVKEGGGQLTLNNPTNSFSGQLRINRGTLNAPGIATNGVNSFLGKGVSGTSIRMGNGVYSGTLILTAGATNTDRNVMIGYSGAGDITHTGGAIINNNTANGGGALIFTRGNFNALNGAATAPRTLTLGGANTDANEIQGIIANNNTAGGGTIALTKTGQGNWTLSNHSNSFTGDISIAQGALTVTSIGSNGVVSAAGAGSQIILGQTNLTQGTIIYTGSGNTTDRTISLTASNSGTITQNGTNGGSGLIFTGTFTNPGGGAKTFNLTGTNTDANAFQSLISDGLGGALTVTKGNSSTWTLANTGNSFSGQMQINAGILNASSIANGGVNSALGKGTTLRIGKDANRGTLNLTAGAATTDRLVQIGDGTGAGGATINNNTPNGAGTLIFSNPAFNLLHAAANTARTLTLGGTNTDANEIQGVIADNNATTGIIAVTKNGPGRWILSGANTYSGNTTVNEGILQIGQATINTNSTVTIASNAVLQLDFATTNVVASLVLNGVLQAPGVYSSNNAPAYITGPGSLQATTGPIGPTLTSVTTPVTGSSYPVTLGLTGSGFTGATAVLLTNLTAAVGASYVPATITGDTNITVSFVPGTAASSWDATVVNGTPSAQVGFAVTATAAVSINPVGLKSAGAGNIVLSGTGGTPGHGYAVLSTTNLNPAVWTPVVTNAFDGSGNFSYTNAVDPGTPKLFLRLQQ